MPRRKSFGIDIAEDSVAYSRRKNRCAIESGRCFVEQGSADALPFEATMFDVVTAYETVYFWPDLPRAFAEVARVLKPGGTFTFSYGLKTDAAMRYWEEQVKAMHLLPTEEITVLLTTAGFINIQTATKGAASINFRAVR
ncbi:MAG: methyltransferase domain-containing protein [Bacteroidaceae bacterium]|nr:methyltransferase domain-containing protein [Bacteroidaceae bacterium]